MPSPCCVPQEKNARLLGAAQQLFGHCQAQKEEIKRLFQQKLDEVGRWAPWGGMWVQGVPSRCLDFPRLLTEGVEPCCCGLMPWGRPCPFSGPP